MMPSTPAAMAIRSQTLRVPPEYPIRESQVWRWPRPAPHPASAGVGDAPGWNGSTKTTILTLTALLALSNPAFAQTSAQREFCQNVATIMRSAAELRDLGQSKKQVMDVQREAARKANLDKDIAKVLLDSVAATYDTNLSPDAVEIINYTICLETRK